jgi:hypothetical protein
MWGVGSFMSPLQLAFVSVPTSFWIVAGAGACAAGLPMLLPSPALRHPLLVAERNQKARSSGKNKDRGSRGKARGKGGGGGGGESLSDEKLWLVETAATFGIFGFYVGLEAGYGAWLVRNNQLAARSAMLSQLNDEKGAFAKTGSGHPQRTCTQCTEEEGRFDVCEKRLKATFLVELGLTDAEGAALSTSLYWGALTAGRLLAVPISAFGVGPDKMIAVDLLGACVATVAFTLLMPVAWPTATAAQQQLQLQQQQQQQEAAAGVSMQGVSGEEAEAAALETAAGAALATSSSSSSLIINDEYGSMMLVLIPIAVGLCLASIFASTLAVAATRMPFTGTYIYIDIY